MRSNGITLKKGKENIFHNQHLWIFSGAIESFPEEFQQGHIYPIYNYNGECLGSGYFHKGHSLCGRILSFGSVDPLQSIYHHLERALKFRASLFDGQVTNAFRIVNGEGDLLPGLVIDQYGEYLVLQSGTLGMDLLKNHIVEFLIGQKRWKGIYEKSVGSSRKEEGLKEIIGTLYGEEIEEFAILEYGLRFNVNWKKGQKTGFFLDQREMRKQIQHLSYGKSVLNCFCYSGGFSVYAAAGGAKHIDSIDVSAQAISWAKHNLVMNGYPEQQSRCIAQDAFKFLTEESLDYDLVILDPPAFAKKKQDIPQATKGYREINFQAMSKMPKGSILLTCSCSYYIDSTLFQTIIFQAAKMAKKNVQIIGNHTIAMDHPINLFHPESSYLKSMLLYLF